MFKATVEALSHEGGLIAPFTGSSPALGSIIVRIDDGTYIGKIDAVLGSTDSPIAHIAHLDRKMNPNDFIGCEAQIRPKIAKQDNRESNRGNRHAGNKLRQSYNRERGDRSHRDNQSRTNRQDNRSRYSQSNRDNQSRPNWRDNQRSDNRRDRRDNRRESDRRNTNRGDGRGRDFRKRDSRDGGGQNKIFADNDWVCQKCSNVNFSFRKECNRCGEPKSGSSSRDRPSHRHNNQTRNRPARSDNNRKFRKARGKSANHAHNRGPQPLNARSRRKNRDD